MVEDSILQKLHQVRQQLKPEVFHRKFTYDNYIQAHEWLDTIFRNGRFVLKPEKSIDQSACFRCGGRCCNEFMMLSEKEKDLPTIVWNEHIYFDDPEFKTGMNGYLICNRQNKKDCNHKLLLCKIHPFYPAKIHLLEEECDFSIYISSYSSTRKMCTSVEFEEWQIQELSLFFRWLYGEFPENRLAYIAHFAIQLEKECLTKEEVHNAFFKGYECSVNKIYRP